MEAVSYYSLCYWGWELCLPFQSSIPFICSTGFSDPSPALNIWLLGPVIRLWLWPLGSELLSRDLSTGSWGKCPLIPLSLRSQPLPPSSSGERLTCGPDAAPYTDARVPRWRRSRLPWTRESYLPSALAGFLHHIQSYIIWKHFLLETFLTHSLRITCVWCPLYTRNSTKNKSWRDWPDEGVRLSHTRK